MSRGPGTVQNQLIDIFTKRGDKIFSTLELCRAIFRGAPVEKRHRVSVLRSLKCRELEALNIYRAVVKGRRDDLWFNRDKAKSALNALLHKAKARNIHIVPAKNKRPTK
jgi:hypothetical protein